jgi:hypothetical protein
MDSERKGMFEDAIKLYDLASVSYTLHWNYSDVMKCTVI